MRSEMNTILAVTIYFIQNVCTRRHTHPQTHFSFSLSWPGALACVVPRLPKSSVDIFKHGAVWMLFFPLLPQYDVFPFLCVFWSLSCGQAVPWWGAGSSGAPVLFLAAAVVGGCWGERRQKGDSVKPRNRGCLRDFCLKELLCNDQRLITDVCVCAVKRERIRARRKGLAWTFIHLALHKHLIYMFSFADHTLRLAKLLNMQKALAFS